MSMEKQNKASFCEEEKNTRFIKRKIKAYGA